MRKILTALVAATTIGAATLSMSSSANAWRGGWGWGWGLGGFAVGALVGSALAAPYYYPYGGYGYYQPAPVYDGYAPGYYSAPGPYYSCWRWQNGYRYRVC